MTTWSHGRTLSISNTSTAIFSSSSWSTAVNRRARWVLLLHRLIVLLLLLMVMVRRIHEVIILLCRTFSLFNHIATTANLLLVAISLASRATITLLTLLMLLLTHEHRGSSGWSLAWRCVHHRHCSLIIILLNAATHHHLLTLHGRCRRRLRWGRRLRCLGALQCLDLLWIATRDRCSSSTATRWYWGVCSLLLSWATLFTSWRGLCRK